MVGENLLDEEAVLKELGINRAQLEDMIRTGKILPSYQNGVRKFRASEIEKIKTQKIEEPPPSAPQPPPQTTQAPPSTPPPAEEVGSTRVIEPPKEVKKLRVKKQEPPKEKPDFLKRPPSTRETVSVGKLPPILLLLSFIVLGLSLGILYLSWKASPLPNFLLSLIKSIARGG